MASPHLIKTERGTFSAKVDFLLRRKTTRRKRHYEIWVCTEDGVPLIEGATKHTLKAARAFVAKKLRRTWSHVDLFGP